MSARDDYPTARFLVQDEPVLDRRFDTAVHREVNAMFDEIDRLRAQLAERDRHIAIQEGITS